MSRQTLSGRGVSGYLPSEHSAFLTDAECQRRCRPDKECQGICLLNIAHVLQTQNIKIEVIQKRSVRALAFGTQHILTDTECQGRCRQDEECQGICLLDVPRVFQTPKSRQMSSGREVSGDLPFKRSALITHEECQGRCCPDEECQGICLLDVALALQTLSINTDVVRTSYAMVSTFWTRSVRAFAFWMQYMAYRCRMSWRMASGRCLP